MVYDYESELAKAYEMVKPCEYCDRFEIKKVEGMHEGTKTIITNFTIVALCVRRDTEHLSRFLFKELASPGNIDGDRLILNRKLSSVLINEKIEKYVDNFVKCSKCGKPDTEITTEGTNSYVKCLACGAKKLVHI